MPSAAPVAVLSHRAWQTAYAATLGGRLYV